MKKPSFWSKLTGGAEADDYDDFFDGDDALEHGSAPLHTATIHGEEDAAHLAPHAGAMTTPEPEEQVGELGVDMYQTDDTIVVKALVAGIQPQNVDISLTRDLVTIKGSREEHREVSDDNYVHKELFWGSFTRTIILPDEVDVDAADASIAHGILVIRLPKVNKDRQTKVKVRAR